jgi:glutathione S-transferase
MATTTLTISSKNYSSWSLRGWLLAKFSGLPFEEVVTAPDDASARAEILLLSSSILVPCLRHEGATVWDTLAIAEYLNEVRPDAGLLPADRVQLAHCRLDLRRNPLRLHDAARVAPVNRRAISGLQDLVARAVAISTGSAPSGALPRAIGRAVPCSAAHHGGRHVCPRRHPLR